MGTLSLRVTPGAKKNALEFGPPLRVRIAAPPHEGKANAALEGYLSALSGAKVRIASGHKGRVKTIVFEGDKGEFLASLKSARQ